MSTESDTIWYSRLSTGIFEVDLQHSNIDQLIELLEKSEDKAKIKESMNILIQAIENHFKYEETRFGDSPEKMDQRHLDEHCRILREYHVMADKVYGRDNKEIKKDIVVMLKVVLMNHVKDFDCKFFQDES